MKPISKEILREYDRHALMPHTRGKLEQFARLRQAGWKVDPTIVGWSRKLRKSDLDTNKFTFFPTVGGTTSGLSPQGKILDQVVWFYLPDFAELFDKAEPRSLKKLGSFNSKELSKVYRDDLTIYYTVWKDYAVGEIDNMGAKSPFVATIRDGGFRVVRDGKAAYIHIESEKRRRPGDWGDTGRVDPSKPAPAKAAKKPVKSLGDTMAFKPVQNVMTKPKAAKKPAKSPAKATKKSEPDEYEEPEGYDLQGKSVDYWEGYYTALKKIYDLIEAPIEGLLDGIGAEMSITVRRLPGPRKDALLRALLNRGKS